jgi:hypothetical protein
MQLISHEELDSAQVSIDFTDIPQDATDLVAYCSLRSDFSDVVTVIYVRPNLLSTNLSGRRLQGNGSTASSGASSDVDFVINAATATANTFGNATIYIPNYAAAVNKSMSSDSVLENNGTTGFQRIHAGLWENTAAITSLRFTLLSGNLIAGSSISLYKITAGSDGTTTVS